MIDPAVLDAMLAAGASADIIVAAVKADQAKDEARREAKRANNAERQQRYRDRNNALRGVTDVIPPASSPFLPPDPQPTPTYTPEEDTTRARKAGSFPCPEGVDPDHWRDFLANRKSKRLTNSPTAYRGILKKLADFADEDWPPGRIVELAAERGWGGIINPHEVHGAHNVQSASTIHRFPARRDRAGEIDDAARNLGFG